MPKPPAKKPHLPDPNAFAFNLVAALTGEPPMPTEEVPAKDPKAVARGRAGGVKGGKARTEAMTPDQRKAAAKKAAAARWRKPG